ncbi:MAG: cytochrome c [Deltaproteobacteria bacterium]|nr:cytochrome c [Deltaproteobacteria bacterium]
MKKEYIVWIVLLAGVAGIGRSAWADPPSGKDLYQKKMCFACHGKEGQGSVSGPVLKNASKQPRNKDELVAFLKKGSVKMRPVNATDGELAALADYILTLK